MITGFVVPINQDNIDHAFKDGLEIGLGLLFIPLGFSILLVYGIPKSYSWTLMPLVVWFVIEIIIHVYFIINIGFFVTNQMAVALQVSFIVFLTFAIILKTCFIIVLWTYYVQLSLEKDMNVTKKTTELVANTRIT
jgi:hypothetical protein